MRGWILVSALIFWAPGLAAAQSPAKGPTWTPREAKPARVAPPARVAAQASPASEVRLSQAGIALALPKGWKAEKGAGDTEAYTLLSSDEVTTLMLFTVPAKDMQATLSDLDKTLQGAVTDATLDAPKEGLVGGMAALRAEGKGKVDGNEVELGLLVVLNEATQRVLVLVGFTLPGKGDGYAKDVAAILHSVRMVK